MDIHDNATRNWFRAILSAARWIMVLVILVTVINLVLNCIALLYSLNWGYSLLSLFIGLLFICMALGIRWIASAGLRHLDVGTGR